MIFPLSIVNLLTIVLVASATPARADDRADCEKQLPELRIRACTNIIEQKTVAKEDRARALANRGRAYMSKTGHDRLAAADFGSASRLVSSTSSDGALYKGLVELANRQLDDAIALFAEAIRREPKNVFAYTARGVAHRLKGDIERALADFEEAIRFAPSLASARGGKAMALSSRKEYERALAELDVAISLDATYASAYRMRALAKSELGRLDEAIADYDSAIRLDPYLAIAYNGRGHVYTKKRDGKRAHSDYDTAVRLDPTLIVALNNRALSFMGRGDRESAIADFERVLALPASFGADRGRQQVARERLQRLKSGSPGAKREGASARPSHRRVALVIGNRTYRHAPVLANPANDAREIAAVLRRLGFTSVMEINDASRNRMAKAVKDFGDLSATAEWAIVFFAGHGIELNGMSYLIPVDAALKRDTHVEDETISLSRVMAKVDAASRIGLVILDACRNNPFASRMVRSVGATRSIGTGLASVEPDGNVLVAYAARHGTVAEDGAGKNSPFTEALLAHIEEPELEINFLFRKVRDMVLARTGRRQEPFIYGSLGSDLMYLRPASAR